MSYEVLARRLRPTTFDDVVGQAHVTTTLRNALLSSRLPHALLLCGPRGVGKTSIARILARSLNCDSGPTDKPCGSCRACSDIASGTSMDVQEIDAASHTGVENVREIRESIRFSAAPGKHRIFIIDEVHMLSQAAFNALLKTLEEPPPRSLFIFATTDPQKMPVTVLSRVQRFDLRRIPAGELLESLTAIAATEKLQISESVLRALIREGEGSFRDVLTLLDRLVSGLGPEIDDARANEILGFIDRRYTRALVDAILSRDPAESLRALERALDQGADPARLAGDVLEELRDLLVARLIADPAGLIDAAPEELSELRARAQAHDAETLQRAYRVLLSRVSELSFAPRPAHALEVAIVRLATLPSTQSLEALLARLDALESGSAPPSGSGSAAGGGSAGNRRATAPKPTAGATKPRPRTREGQAEAPSQADRAAAGPSGSAQAADPERLPARPAGASALPASTPVAALPASDGPASDLLSSDLLASDREAIAPPPETPSTPPAPAARAESPGQAAPPPTSSSPGPAPSARPDDDGPDDDPLPQEPADLALEMEQLHARPAVAARSPLDLGAPPTLEPSPELELGDAPPGRSAGASAGRRVDPEQQRALRIEAKNDPAVLRVIEALDAEIRDIRFSLRSPTP